MKIKHLLCFIALCLFFTPGKAQQLSVMTLRNGATVYIWEDKSKPDVFGMIAFKVGSVDDPEQYTGLAHYLEHVMFKGTQTIDALDWEKEKPIYEKIIAKYDERAALSDPAAREAVDKEINDLTREAAQYAAGNEFSLLVERRFSFPPCNRFYIQMKTLFWLTRHRNGDYYAHINVSLESL